MMTEIEKQILDHANSIADEEVCGLVVETDNKLKYIKCENVAQDKANTFLISQEDFLSASESGLIRYVVHSHINHVNYLSTQDRLTQLSCEYPFILACDNNLTYVEARPPLLCREFEHENQDCRTLLLDCFNLCGVQLNRKERYNNDWYKNENLYVESLIKYGFEEVKNPQFGDIILFNIGGKYPNHAGFLLKNGDILHHQIDRLSLREPLNRYLFNRIHSYWRYKEWQQLDFTAVYQDLQIVSNWT